MQQYLDELQMGAIVKINGHESACPEVLSSFFGASGSEGDRRIHYEL